MMLQTAYPGHVSRQLQRNWTGLSPILAILWEHWRLTLGESAWRLSIGLVGGSAALALSGSGATIAVWVLLSQHAIFSMSIAKLAGGRLMDGYRPGFPLHLLYSRPVPTSVIVGVAMMYDAVSGAAMYAASAALLGLAFGQTLPLLSMAMLIMVFRMVCLFVQWSTRSRVFQWLGSSGIWVAVIALFNIRAGGSPLQLDFSFAETALMASIGLVSFALTVAGVSRQRRGDAREAIPRTKGSGAADWFAGLFRFACPTSSPIAAQVWSDLRSSGLLVLAIGLALAIVIPLLFVVTTRLDVALSGVFTEPLTRGVALGVAMLSLPAMLVLFGGNAFGIRARQGRTYASAFEATQACGTAGMAGLKVLVRSACLLAALGAVGASVWTSASVIPFDVFEDNDTFIEKSRNPVSGLMRAIEGAVGAMSAYELLALAFVAAVVVVVMVAARAAFTALRARYPRRVNIAGSLLLLYGLGLVLLFQAEQYGIASEFVLYEAQDVTNSVIAVVAAASALATVYLFWIVLAERLLSLRHACGALLVSAAFAAAWVTVLGAAGVRLAGMPTTDAFWMLSPALLPLTASVLAPWSLDRIRHT
jgi:hypothetical protein